MAQLIPVFLSTSSDFTENVELDGEIVGLRIQWNVRNDTAFLTFIDVNGSEISSIKVVPNWPLLRQLKGSIAFDGDLMVVKEDDNVSTEITYDNFGNGQNLYYIDEAEVSLWEDAYGSR